jgi:small subunit ribosomal protein S17
MSKILTGVVVSNKMSKTIVVDVAKKFQHPRFRKIVNIHKKFKVHVEEGTVEVGSVVRIQETKPISKDKHFVLLPGLVTEKKQTKKTETKETTNEAAAVVKEPAQKPVQKTTKKTAVKTAKATKKPVKTAKKKVSNSKK